MTLKDVYVAHFVCIDALQFLLWVGICLVNAPRQEVALDAVGIADTYLDVVLLSKPGIGIK